MYKVLCYQFIEKYAFKYGNEVIDTANETDEFYIMAHFGDELWQTLESIVNRDGLVTALCDMKNGTHWIVTVALI